MAEHRVWVVVDGVDARSLAVDVGQHRGGAVDTTDALLEEQSLGGERVV